MEATPQLDRKIERITLPIEGMTCAACASRIERRLIKESGVGGATVNYATEEAVVDLIDDSLPLSTLIHSVQQAGYDVRRESLDLPIERDPALLDVESRLLALDGVLSVDRVGAQLKVDFLPGVVAAADIERAAGLTSKYTARGRKPVDPAAVHERRYRRLRQRFVGAAALTLPVVVVSMSHGRISFAGDTWLMLVLTIPVVFWCGSIFLTGAWKALRHGAADMNTLVAMGVLAAFAYSVVATVRPDLFLATGTEPAVYFEAAAVIVTLILLGRVLEERAKGRTGEAIQKLLRIQPQTAHLLRDGTTVDLPIEAVAVGDHLVVRPGERIPLDGLIIDGHAAIDESALTGEPIPVDKASGDSVLAGAVCTNGSITVSVEKVGSATLLQQIVRLVGEAQSGKAPIQRLADKVAGIFVPAVIVVAAVAGATWLFLGPEPVVTNAVLRFVTVLIISCPCALGLATPTAIMVATGRAASAGVLIRDGAAIETIADVEVMLLDKTGTLTEGRPDVEDVVALDGSADDVLRLAASVESRSEHPLARAIVRKAEAAHAELLPVSNFESSSGLGVRGMTSKGVIAVGRESYISDLLGRTLDNPEARSYVERHQTAVYVAADSRLIGMILIADPIRPTSSDAIRQFAELGIESIMLTGDRDESAESVASSVGIREFHAGLLPTDKTSVVNQKKSAGQVTAMVGDGINDAPALATADVGISMGGGTDIAVEASDVTIMRNDLRAVAYGIRLSRAGLRVIKQNLFFAFIYNVVLIPVAAGALYPVWGILLSPIFASAAMALSSVSVVANSLRLRKI